MNLQEHIELYRRLKIPFKKQFITLALELARQHYNQELELLVDSGKGQKTMTLKEFVEACMSPYAPDPCMVMPPVVKPVVFTAPHRKPTPVKLKVRTKPARKRPRAKGAQASKGVRK